MSDSENEVSGDELDEASEALLESAHEALEAGDLEGAAAHLAELQERAPEASATHLLEAHIAAASGDYETALACAEVASEDGDPIALLAYASLLVELAGDTGTAMLVLEEATLGLDEVEGVDEESQAALAALHADVLALLAQCRLAERNPIGAKEAAERVLALDEQHPDGHAQLAAALLNLGDLDGAEAAARKARALDPDEPARAYALGLVLRLTKKHAEASAAFASAAAADGEAFPAPIRVSRAAATRALDEVVRKAPALLATYFGKLRGLPIEILDEADVARSVTAGISPLKALSFAGPSAEEAEASVPLHHLPTSVWISLDALGSLVESESELEACLTALFAEEVGSFLGLDEELE